MSILRALINYDEMLEGYKNQGVGMPTPATDLLYQNPRDCISDDVKVLFSSMMKRPAPFNRRGAVARVLDKHGKSSREAAMFVQFNMQQFTQDVFMAVLADEQGRSIQAKAATEVEFQTEYAKGRHVMSKEALAGKVLTGATVYLDQQGDLQEATDAGYDAITFGFNSAHQGQLNNGTSTIIGTSWDNDAAPILDDIEEIDERMAEENQAPIVRIIAPYSMKKHLRSNTQFAAWVLANPALAELSLRGDVYPDIAGKKWEFWNSTYEAADGTHKKIIPDGRLVMLPANMDWVRPLRGMTLVPTSIEVGSGLNNLNEAYGEFAYTKMSENPIGLDSFMGDVFGWCVTNPDAVMQPDVVFG